MSATVKLKVGSKIQFDSHIHTVEAIDGLTVRLRSLKGLLSIVTMAGLIMADGFAVLDAGDAHDVAREQHHLDCLSKGARARAERLEADLNEAWTGYRSGKAETAAADEPRSGYDPNATTLSERVARKARELGRTGRSLWDLWNKLQQFGLIGIADKRAIRRATALDRLNPDVRQAIEEELIAQANKSTFSQKHYYRLVKERLKAQAAQRARETQQPCAPPPMPSRSTFYRALRQLTKGRSTFGDARARRSIANRPLTPYRRFTPVRPGEYVLIDGYVYDVYAFDPYTCTWTSVELLLALDLYTRSILAWRFVPVGGKDVEASLLLADILWPKPMREGWPEAAAWRYHGVPSTLLVPEWGDRPLAGIPVVRPETLIVDHGMIFKSRAVRDGCTRLGCSLLPARPHTPTDKAQLERLFERIRVELLEFLPGYKGPDVSHRGDHPEEDAFYFVGELDDLFGKWVATFYQRTPHEGLYLPSAPTIPISPNDMYDEGIARAGFLMVPKDPDLYYNLLRTRWRTIQHYGVEIDGLIYDGAVLNEFRGRTSPHTDGRECRARKKGITGQWPFRIDPRDLSHIYFQHPTTNEWHTLTCRVLGSARPFSDVSLARTKAVVIARGGNVKDSMQVAEAMEHLLDDVDEHARERKAALRALKRDFLNVQRAQQDRPRVAWPANADSEMDGSELPDEVDVDLAQLTPMRVARDDDEPADDQVDQLDGES